MVPPRNLCPRASFPGLVRGQHLPDPQGSAPMALSPNHHTILFKFRASSLSPRPFPRLWIRAHLCFCLDLPGWSLLHPWRWARSSCSVREHARASSQSNRFFLCTEGCNERGDERGEDAPTPAARDPPSGQCVMTTTLTGNGPGRTPGLAKDGLYPTGPHDHPTGTPVLWMCVRSLRAVK